jgi:toxin-antitoxin system PIN domain toxin
VRPYLLDTNVLIALAWPSHVHHLRSQQWFVRTRQVGFRTCPITEAGFVRICEPAFSKDATPNEALALLLQITALPGHSFWKDDIAVTKALAGASNLTGHRQVTDAYLLPLARAHEGTLGTLNRGLLNLVTDRTLVHLITEAV